MNYYPRYPGDYLAKTLDLTMVEDGAYTRLIDWYYSNERPIAHERRYAVGRATTPVERQAVDSVLAGFFERDGDVWRHDRIDEEISKATPRIEAAKANGSRGGRPKKNPAGNPQGNPAGNPTGSADGNPTGSEDKTQRASSPTPTPETSTENHHQQGSGLVDDDDGPPEAGGMPPTAYGAITRRLMAAGIVRCNPGHLGFKALVDAGATVDDFLAYVDSTLKAKPNDPFKYLVATVEGERRRIAEAGPLPAKTEDPMAWRKTFEGVQRRAAELGLKPRTGEMAPDFERRVLTAHQRAAGAAQGATA